MLAKRVVRRARRRLRILSGTEVNTHVEIACPRERLGSEYGGWYVDPTRLTPSSTVYSFGVGEDISFDLEMIGRFSLHVHAFDPTPQSISWVRRQELDQRFHLHEYGIAATDGSATFLTPPVAGYVSHSAVAHWKPRHGTTQLPVRSLSTIARELGHREIEVLKMDIEGSEYEVIDQLGHLDLDVRQILVEFHHRFPGIGPDQTKRAIRQLSQAGYKIFAISDTGEEYSFVRDA